MLVCTILVFSCHTITDVSIAKNDILQAEKAFEKMASEKGLTEAFFFFADENATILRGNDSLISGKENIRHYYEKRYNPNVTLKWTPDFVDVSDCGTLGYTYGRYTYTVKDSTGKSKEYYGIFHTVWKKRGNDWKYVWD
ncbi:MAG: nuclear transport factor 2 family protein [Bacteroidota bacterium]|nr:nuclear transport factor 2 family protein [Bacteroidota bacterium]